MSISNWYDKAAFFVSAVSLIGCVASLTCHQGHLIATAVAVSAFAASALKAIADRSTRASVLQITASAACGLFATAAVLAGDHAEFEFGMACSTLFAIFATTLGFVNIQRTRNQQMLV